MSRNDSANYELSASTFPSTRCPLLSEPSHFDSVVIPSIYLALCVVGLIGNGLVLFLLIKQDRKRQHGNQRSVTNILVINLAIADFIFVGALPFWATERYLGGVWVFGTVGCKLLSFVSLINLYGSVFFLVAMGIDRYLAIVFAVRARNYRTPKNAMRVCLVIWLFASFIASQGLFFREIKETCVPDSRCSWVFPSSKAFLVAYFVVRTSLGFFLPFFVILYCYIFIIVSLRKRSKSLLASGARITNKQHKVTRLILTVISLFVLCWFPNHIITLMTAIFIYDEEKRASLNLDTANLISTCLAYANSSLNPILYAFMKEDLRQELIALVRKCYGLPDLSEDHFLRMNKRNKSKVEVKEKKKSLGILNKKSSSDGSRKIGAASENCEVCENGEKNHETKTLTLSEYSLSRERLLADIPPDESSVNQSRRTEEAANTVVVVGKEEIETLVINVA